MVKYYRFKPADFAGIVSVVIVR